MDILPSYPRYTSGRSCFAKRFSKTDSTPLQNPLHQHNHSRSCHSCSQSPTKRTLNKLLMQLRDSKQMVTRKWCCGMKTPPPI
jgi:hypothetical protein